MTQKIGIFGGSFNPIHLGHLIFAQEALEQLSLDKVIFIPAYHPPHKEAGELANSQARLEMVREAVKDIPEFEVSDMEIARGGYSYTIDTIREFAGGMQPGTEIYLLIGMDMLLDYFTWKEAETLMQLCTLVGAPRPGFLLNNLDSRLSGHLKIIQMPLIEIAGKDIRKRIRNQRAFRFMVTERVYNYIKKNRLYLN